MVGPFSFSSRHALVLLSLLAACADPATRCSGPEVRELRTIDRLIDETQAGIARGYRREQVDSGANINLCVGSQRSNVGVSFCTDPGTRTRTVAIDEAAEARKLEALLARRDRLLAAIAARQSSCGPDL